MTITDQSQRQQALSPTTSFIVQAPAGSGKTELLTQRILVLLAQAVQQPEEIIAITFTRKAASEMRERVMEALHLAAEQPKPNEPHKQHTWSLAQAVLKKDQQATWSLLSNPSRLNILTIDSLTAMINAKTPLLSQVGSQPTITDQAEIYYHEAIEDLLEQTGQDSDIGQALCTILLQCDNRTATVIPLLSQLLAKRQQWLPHVVHRITATDELKQSLENALCNTMLETCQYVDQCLPADLWHDIQIQAQQAGHALYQEQPTDAHDKLNTLPHPLIVSSDHLPYWCAIADLLVTKSGQWRRSLTKKHGFPPKSPQKIAMTALLQRIQHDDALADAFHELSRYPTPHYTNAQWQLLQALLLVLPHAAAYLTVVFQRHNTIDFCELTLAALRSLGDADQPTDIALYLDHRIQHILVDEFQDTSIAQFELLQRITQDWQDGDGRTAFFVGDPMQSIYRFRNAEVSLFLQAQQHGFGTIALTPLQLHMNFRSKQPIVSWINESFSTIFPAVADMTYGAVPLSEATSANPSTSQSVFHYTHLQTSEHSQGELIAQTILALQHQYPDQTMAILVRSRHQLHDILPALDRHHISKHSTDIDALYSRSEIQDLLSLTRALSSINDRMAWLAVLRSPAIGMSLADLLSITHINTERTLWHNLQHHDAPEQLTPHGREQRQHLLPILSDAMQKRGKQPLCHLVKGTWLALGGAQAIKDAQALQHCQTFFELLAQLEQQHTHVDLERLETAMQRLFASPMHDNTNAVHIMTIHKSKGLEFDHVFLPHLESTSRSHDAELLLWQERPTTGGGSHLLLAPIKSTGSVNDPIYDVLKRHDNKKQYHENQRLLYVATTRAKQGLHLCATVNEDEQGQIKAPPSNSFLHLLWADHQDHFQQETPINTPDTHIAATSTHAFYHHRLPISDPQRYVPPTLNPTNDPTHFHHTVTFDVPLPQQDLPRIKGIAIHAVLQQLADHGHGNDPAAIHRHAQRLLRTHRAPVSCIDVVAHEITNTVLAVQQDPKGRWILSSDHPTHHSEYALTTCIDGLIQQHIIDRLIIDQEGTLWVIDYKTATPMPGEDVDAFMQTTQAHHEAQLKRYHDALAMQFNHRIQVALYFPTCLEWISWSYTPLTEEIT